MFKFDAGLEQEKYVKERNKRDLTKKTKKKRMFSSVSDEKH